VLQQRRVRVCLPPDRSVSMIAGLRACYLDVIREGDMDGVFLDLPGRVRQFRWPARMRPYVACFY